MLTVNLFDSSCKHLRTADGVYSITDNRVPKHLRYVHDLMDFNGITLFTDNFLDENLIQRVNSKVKIAWIIEPREIKPWIYDKIQDIVPYVDYIFTYDQILINTYPDKGRMYPYGGCWILDKYKGIYEKAKNVCMIYSNKTKATGHKFRHEIANIANEFGIDLYGSGCGKDFNMKEEFLANYKYSIVLENCSIENYFTEKILDCFALGTIPIYWGCKNINDFFNNVITFENIDQLKNILNNLPNWDDQLDSIQNNFDKVSKYETQEDYLYFNYLYDIATQLNLPFDDIHPTDNRTRVNGVSQEFFLNMFQTSGGDSMLYRRISEDLQENDVVFDVGSYDGEFAKNLLTSSDKNLKIYSFEPVKTFHDRHKSMNNDFYDKHKKFNINDNILLNFGLGVKDEDIEIGMSENASGLITNGEKISIQLKSIEDFIRNNNIQRIDLFKLNIEGSEYDLLEYLLKSGLYSIVKTFLVQFHYIKINPQKRRSYIVNSLLEQGYKEKFNYSFVWECYSRK